MNPIAFAMTGLIFGLWVNAFALLGIGAKPVEGVGSPTKTVAAAGSLVAAITLIFMAIWLTVGQPFGVAEPVNVLFAAIGGMYGLLWIGVFAVQWFELDGRPAGNLCLLMAIMQVIHMIGVGYVVGTVGWHVWLVQVVLASYIVLLLLFWGLFYGKVSARLTGWWTIVTCITTAYLLWFGGGIFPTP
ncbi:hypothetical protein M1O56_06415 [Dehalococcoidia bacterium]|nr:hypothetical protein [Dehalococcoidia bacterium]